MLLGVQLINEIGFRAESRFVIPERKPCDRKATVNFNAIHKIMLNTNQRTLILRLSLALYKSIQYSLWVYRHIQFQSTIFVK